MKLVGGTETTEKRHHIPNLVRLPVLPLGHLLVIKHLLDLRKRVVFIEVHGVLEPPIVFRVGVGEAQPHLVQLRRLLQRDAELAVRVYQQLFKAWRAYDDVPCLVDVKDLQILHGAAPRDDATKVVIRRGHSVKPEQPQSAQACR